MRTAHRHSIVLAVLAGFLFALAPEAHAQAKRKPKPATQADISRLEKKIEDQQKLIDKLVKLQQHYLQALTAIFEGTPVPTPAPIPTAVDKPLGVDATKAVEIKPRTTVVDTVKPVVKPKKEAAGVGIIVGKVEGAADAIVYIEDISAPVQASAAMKQEGKQFVPQVLVVTKGTTVEFPNRDAVFHNVFSVTPENSFDLGSYRQGESKNVKMARPGVVTVYCNMHPQMVGHILVVPNSNYVRAGKDGFFRLTNVPAGPHRVVAWAPNAKPTVVQAIVTADEAVSIELAVKKGRASSHTKKDGLPYGSYEK